MTTLLVIRWVHLVAVATWTGGLIVLAALVVALRRAGADRALLRAAARQFGTVSWTAMSVAILTGLAQVHLLGWPWSYGRLHLKIGLVVAVIVVAAVHQRTAARSSPAVRGLVQLAVLLLSLGIFGVAVLLG